ncbi:hypothetical protein B0H15DRAFT_817612 [Mycena belliarum]|uniref:Secreted protein n=1 Tax=Mycena belliarum TaxID=1033014 RepID=A0AAD6XSX8_9AGAR|nr:hypothetical protein B0H15DRAFT_817612 [Mycena belliae]
MLGRGRARLIVTINIFWCCGSVDVGATPSATVKSCVSAHSRIGLEAEEGLLGVKLWLRELVIVVKASRFYRF